MLVLAINRDAIVFVLFTSSDEKHSETEEYIYTYTHTHTIKRRGILKTWNKGNMLGFSWWTNNGGNLRVLIHVGYLKNESWKWMKRDIIFWLIKESSPSSSTELVPVGITRSSLLIYDNWHAKPTIDVLWVYVLLKPEAWIIYEGIILPRVITIDENFLSLEFENQLKHITRCTFNILGT